jgi:uncharacterized protein YjiS (DUF1127 family)
MAALRATAALRMADLMELWRQRRALDELDDRTLDDIGVRRHAARQEASRSFWDVPANWLR